MIATAPREYAAIEEALLGTREPSRGMSWRLVIGDEDYSQAVDASSALVLSGEADGPAITLTGMLGRKVPLDDEGADVTLYMMVADTEVQRFGGILLLPEHTRGGTNLGATTAGAFAETTEIGEFLQFTNWPPHQVAYHVLTRLPYDLSQLEVAFVESPPMTRSGETGYSKHTDVAEVMDDVANEAALWWTDNSFGGASLFAEPTLADGAGASPAWTFEVGRDIASEEDAFSVERTADRYREVVVVRNRVSPLVTQDPLQELARAQVPGSRAPMGTRLLIELSEGATAADAYPRAYTEADILARRWRLGFEASYYHPLLERGDVIAVIEPGRDEHGRYRKTWAAVIDTDELTLPNKSGSYEGDAQLVQVERVTRSQVELGRVPGSAPGSGTVAAPSVPLEPLPPSPVTVNLTRLQATSLLIHAVASSPGAPSSTPLGVLAATAALQTAEVGAGAPPPTSVEVDTLAATAGLRDAAASVDDGSGGVQFGFDEDGYFWFDDVVNYMGVDSEAGEAGGFWFDEELAADNEKVGIDETGYFWVDEDMA